MSTVSIVLVIIAVMILAAVLFVIYRTRKTERANPPLGKFMNVDGVRLHYVERGQGQPLVLLHGNGSMMQDFDISGLVELASADYRVIVFDRPGYGYSSRPRGIRIWNPKAQAQLLRKALQRLQVERPVVVGHSWGTLVALALALEYPAHVRSLVLLSGYYFPTFRPDVALFAPPAIPLIGDVMRYTISPLLGRLIWPGLLRTIFGPPPTPPRFKGQFPVWMALRPSQLRASAAESALMIPWAIKLRRRYHEIKMPVVIMAGSKDRFVSAKHSARLHAAVPQSDFRLAPGMGHMVHHEAPREVRQAIDIAAAA